jgi:hypothetical protein
MALIKTFGKVEAGEYIYTINPIEGSITPLLVKETSGAYLSIEQVKIVYYRLKPVPNVSLEDLLARAKEVGTLVTTGKLIAPRLFSNCITNTFPPLIFATTEEDLASWAKLKNR